MQFRIQAASFKLSRTFSYPEKTQTVPEETILNLPDRNTASCSSRLNSNRGEAFGQQLLQLSAFPSSELANGRIAKLRYRSLLHGRSQLRP
jgi:hypothetical protein